MSQSKNIEISQNKTFESSLKEWFYILDNYISSMAITADNIFFFEIIKEWERYKINESTIEQLKKDWTIDENIEATQIARLVSKNVDGDGKKNIIPKEFRKKLLDLSEIWLFIRELETIKVQESYKSAVDRILKEQFWNE